MKVKDSSIKIHGLQLPMRRVMKVCEVEYKKYGQDYIITAGLDGEHMAGSYHYFGYALDSRVYTLSLEDQNKLAEEIRTQLGAAYTVLLHPDHHLHIQYNVQSIEGGLQ